MKFKNSLACYGHHFLKFASLNVRVKINKNKAPVDNIWNLAHWLVDDNFFELKYTVTFCFFRVSLDVNLYGKGDNIKSLYQRVVCEINHTHPSMG